MGAGFFVRLKRKDWLGELSGVEAVNNAALCRNYEVLFNLMVPLSTLDVFAYTRIELVRKSAVAVTHIEDVQLRVVAASQQ
jgi:hypothetical protein